VRKKQDGGLMATFYERLDGAPLWRPSGPPPGSGLIEAALLGSSLAKPAMVSFAQTHPTITVRRMAFVDYRQEAWPDRIALETGGEAAEVVVGDIQSLADYPHLAKIFIAGGDRTIDRRAAGKAGRILAEAGVSGFQYAGSYKFNRSRFYDPDFFHKYESRLEALYSLLADEFSRAILTGLVKARLTGDNGYIPVSGHPEYYHPALEITEGAVLVDGGVSENLSETLKFSDAVGPRGLVAGFEPNPEAFATAEAGLAKRGVKNVRLVNCGLWHENDTLPFIGGGVGGRVLSPGADAGDSATDAPALCQLTSLDAYCLETGLSPDVIKLDVEGAELAALQGAEGVIRRRKPKLIVCLYHKALDFLEIIEWLAQLKLDYSFFLGHHFINDYETVLYAG
jgi:FkbM family methyltransferase